MDPVYAATNGGMGQDFKRKENGLRTNALNKLADVVLNRIHVKMRLHEYKSTLIDKGLNYFISVKLLILETTVSQCLCPDWNNLPDYIHSSHSVENF